LQSITRGWARLAAALVPIVLLGTVQAGVASGEVTTPVALRDAAPDVGINESIRTFSVAVADYDGDGRRDALIVRHDPQSSSTEEGIPRPRLWHNNLPSPWNDTGSFFTQRDRHGCDWGDANGNGRPDLACSVGLTAASDNELWIQKRDGSFGDRSQVSRIKDDSFHGRARGVTFIDANGDERLDLYFSRWTGCDANLPLCGAEEVRYPNRLYLNLGNNEYGTPIYAKADDSWGVNEAIGAPKDTEACLQAVDHDRDGDQDLLVCARDEMVLYRNENNQYFTRQIDGLKWKDAEIRRVDADPYPDLVEMRGAEIQIRYGNGDGSFGAGIVLMNFSNSGEDIALGDINGDGFKDIYIVRRSRYDAASSPNSPDILLVNNGDRSFSGQLVQGTTEGSGDMAAVLDYNLDGKADFLVTNGNKLKAGPVELWTEGDSTQ
jgi:FG-GAP-like repeat